LIAGAIKENKDLNNLRTSSNRGYYFIANIVDIVSIRDLTNLNEYRNLIEYQNSSNSWINNALRDNSPSIDERNAILFSNPTEIKKFSTSSFSFLSNPITYIV